MMFPQCLSTFVQVTECKKGRQTLATMCIYIYICRYILFVSQFFQANAFETLVVHSYRAVGSDLPPKTTMSLHEGSSIATDAQAK